MNEISRVLKRDKSYFEEYAIVDAMISLKHATEMELVNLSVKQLGIPVTLAALGRNFVFEEWRGNMNKHFPYQISGKCLMGNADEVKTPKGCLLAVMLGYTSVTTLEILRVGWMKVLCTGVRKKTYWYDYDLISAYTTGMKDLALPYYKSGHLITTENLKKWSTGDLLSGYLIINCRLKFPRDVKYPSIPCYVDESTTVYPLEGKGLLTGPEYILALSQGCKLDIKSVFYIPPTIEVKDLEMEKGSNEVDDSNDSNDSKKEFVLPFQNIIKELQENRGKYPKGSFNNLFYKEIGNSIYGNVVRGLSNKKSFDTMTGEMFRIKGTELSNPILASWTTAFIRSVIGECLHNISKLKGKVVSVTTDGFITNIADLESKLLNLKEEEEIPLLTKYRSLRKDLGGCDALEVKKEGLGILSWTTRGQLGIGSSIKATTGFKVGDLEH